MMESSPVKRRTFKRPIKKEDVLLEKAVLGGDEDLCMQFQKCVKSAVRRPRSLKKRKPVWEDQDPNNSPLEYQTPGWADLQKIDERTKQELLEETHASDFLKHQKSSVLTNNLLSIKHCRDLNKECSAAGKLLTNVEFHPTASVAVVSGKNGISSLFQVDGKDNPKIQSVIFKNFPIITSHFSADGEQLIVGSHICNYYYYYDMLSGKTVQVPWNKDMENGCMPRFEISPNGNLIAFQGKSGRVHLVTAKSKEWINTLKFNGDVRALAFNKNGDRLYTHGELGNVHVWDMTTRDCIHKFYDDGCITGTSVSVSPNGQYIACGSDSGVVNIYEAASLLSSATPRPKKILLNLTTSVTKLKFNHSSEFMVMSSDEKENAIRIVHCPSMQVFPNFPKSNCNLGAPLCYDVSLNSGFFSISNNLGKCFLYRLNHYESF